MDTTLSRTASLVYSTFLGGNGEEYGYGAALDCAGNAYVTGRTSSTTFITTTGGLQPGAGGGGNDAFVAKIGATRVITYAYDGVQRLTDAVECPGSTYHYGYDLASNRTLETVDGVAQQQVSYDAANQVITATTPQGTASYSYDQAGNLLSDGTRNYSYDALDRLTALAGAGATESYGYNGDGTLVTQTVNGIPTAYTQDLAAGQSQVLQTATGTGAPAVTDYLYGLDRLASVPSGGGARTWYMPDLQGSVRYTTDDGANASPTVNYDPYGTPEGGAVPPTFGYDGELQDGATGLQNLRARTYNPATGQFLTRDPLEQQTGQAYVYAGGDPVNGSDPSGACTVFGFETPGTSYPGIPCSSVLLGQTAQAIAAKVLDPSASPVYYPMVADKNCLYAQALRIAAARPLLAHGFDVGPVKRVAGLYAGVAVAGAEHVLEQASQVVEQAIAKNTVKVLGTAVLPRVAVAATLAGVLYFVTSPPTQAYAPDAPPTTGTRTRQGSEILYHYTNEAAAQAIYIERRLIPTQEYTDPSGNLLPRGGYATDISPFTPGLTQTDIASIFYYNPRRVRAAVRRGDTSWYVAILNGQEQQPPFVPIPNVPRQYVAAVPPYVTSVPIVPISFGRNPMRAS